jgi:hypothetical protein
MIAAEAQRIPNFPLRLCGVTFAARALRHGGAAVCPEERNALTNARESVRVCALYLRRF